MTDLTEREKQIVAWLRGEGAKCLALVGEVPNLDEQRARRAANRLNNLARAIERGEPWKDSRP